MGASLDIPSYEIEKDPNTLRGLSSKLAHISHVVVPQGLDHDGPFSEIIVPEYFPPGSIMLFATQLQETDLSIDKFCMSGTRDAFGELDFVELNAVLYRADGEERDVTHGEFGVYDVPGLGKMVYCGLEGWMYSLKHIMRNNDLGHPLCAHLREGTWALDYVHARQFKYVSLTSVETFSDYLRQQTSWNITKTRETRQMVPGAIRADQEEYTVVLAAKILCARHLRGIQGFSSRRF